MTQTYKGIEYHGIDEVGCIIWLCGGVLWRWFSAKRIVMYFVGEGKI